MKIQFEKVNYRYSPNTEEIFQSLSWRSTSPETIGLLGVNGSGKSTFLRLLGGLIKPSSGKILLGGTSISGISSVKSKLCFVPENARLFLMGPSLRRELKRLNKSDAEISTLIQKSDFDKLVDKKIYLLSEGQRRLIAIWLAFQLDRQIILLDEPTIGMDINGKIIFSKLLEKAVSSGKTVIIASNDSRILPLFDRISVIQEKGIKLDGAPKEVLYKLEKTTNLIPNQVVRLISSMNDSGFDIPHYTNISELNAYLTRIERRKT